MMEPMFLIVKKFTTSVIVCWYPESHRHDENAALA